MPSCAVVDTICSEVRQNCADFETIFQQNCAEFQTIFAQIKLYEICADLCFFRSTS